MRRYFFRHAAPLLGLATLLLLFANPANGQSAQAPAGQYTIIILGDSMGDGIYAGMYQLLKGDKNIKLVRLSKVGSGLFNLNMEAWRKELAAAVTLHKPNLALVVLGGNDPQPIIYNGKMREPFKTEEWRRLYTERVNEYLQTLQNHNLSVFWIGMPVMRPAEYDQDIQYLSELYAECAGKKGVPYISTRKLVVNEDGEFMAFGEDLTGRKTQLRVKDGKHFTQAGYEILANFILDAIKNKLPTFVYRLNNG